MFSQECVCSPASGPRSLSSLRSFLGGGVTLLTGPRSFPGVEEIPLFWSWPGTLPQSGPSTGLYPQPGPGQGYPKLEPGQRYPPSQDQNRSIPQPGPRQGYPQPGPVLYPDSELSMTSYLE